MPNVGIEVVTCVLDSRTVLLPKSQRPENASEFRPISIGNSFCRLFHKILSARLSATFPIMESQRAFRPMDGMSANVAILDTLLGDSKRSLRPLHLAFVDLRKAFDSVSHETILRNAKRLGCPEHLLGYLREYYANGTTEVLGSRMRLTNGVRQGDPLSPLLFNGVIDEALVALKGTGYGYELNGEKIQCLAFADDLVLVAKSRVGLQSLTDLVTGHLAVGGLKPNPAKCAAMAITIDGKRKRYLCDARPFLKVSGQVVASLDANGVYKYLGIPFSASQGKVQGHIDDLVGMLTNVTHAPLKPQQRLFILRQNILPRLYHSLVLGRSTVSLLNKLDRTVRNTVRKWLRLPKDTPLGFFHARAVDGGLQIPSLRTTIPRLSKERRGKLSVAPDTDTGAASIADVFLKESTRLARMARIKGVTVEDKNAEQRLWKAELLKSRDGVGLGNIGEVGSVNGWVTAGTRIMRGEMFIKALKIRGNLWYSRARASRGRGTGAPMCDAGCRARETLGHMLQSCCRTHDRRVERHNRVEALLASECRSKGLDVFVEPRIPTPAGIRVPDLVIRKGAEAFVIDVTIVADAGVAELSNAHKLKVAYYQREEEAIGDWTRTRWPEAQLKFGALVMSWRGALCSLSALTLRELGLSKRFMELLVVRCLEGSVMTAEVYSRRTTRKCT